MFDWIHCRTAHFGPAIALHTVLVGKLFPAFNTGLSMRPPPATIPTTARHVDGIDLREPDGNRIRLFFPSSEWPTIMHEVPDARAKRPRSVAFSSTIEMTVPSGIFARGNTFPTESCALDP